MQEIMRARNTNNFMKIQNTEKIIVVNITL